MTGIQMCIVYTLLYLNSFADKGQTLGMKSTRQKAEFKFRASEHSNEEEETPNQHTSHTVSETTEPSNSSCTCSQIYDPVCASNGHSYYNLCQMECDHAIDNNVTVLHQGNCIPFRRTLTTILR